jgi:arylsulfatase A
LFVFRATTGGGKLHTLLPDGYKFKLSATYFTCLLMTIRLLLALLLSTVLLGLPAWAQQPQPATQPNIIFIMADDMAQADLGCYGNPFNETPNINKLAQSGLRFTQAYSASPVCSPSRASILTGKHPARLGLTNFMGGERKDPASPVLPAPWVHALPATELTIAERLKPLGYQTGFVGKWHVGDGETAAPWNQGFDFARMIGKNSIDYYNYSIYEDSYKQEFVDHGTNYLTDKLTDYALEYIGKQKVGQPFFLYLCYSAPHVFLVPRGDKVSKYLNKYEKFEGKYNPYYGAMIESLDDGVGRVQQLLQQMGLDKNTLIVFTADNGGLGLPELGPTPTTAGTLRKWKGFTYEGGVRVPALVSWPGQVPAGQTSAHYFINTDYTPTFLELLGQPTTDVLPDARSIAPVLRNPQAVFDRGPIFWHYPHFSNQTSRPAGAVRSGDWKLVKSYEANQVELFNLKEDESEKTDLSKKNKVKTAELEQLLTQWQTAVGANMPVRKPAKK